MTSSVGTGSIRMGVILQYWNAEIAMAGVRELGRIAQRNRARNASHLGLLPVPGAGGPAGASAATGVRAM